MTDFDKIIKVAELCKHVYTHTETTEELGILGMRDFSNGFDYGCVYINENTLYVVIAGTNDRDDWASNIKAVKRADWYGMSGHRGFIQGARALEQLMLDVINDYQGRDLIFAGHSRGGAIALLLAMAAEHHHRHWNSTCITFGQPRISSGAQTRLGYRNGKLIRVVNGSDAVPRYPKIGYGHAGTCLYLHDGKHLVDPGETRQFIDRTFTLRQFNRGHDHSMAHYVRELKSCAKSQ